MFILTLHMELLLPVVELTSFQSQYEYCNYIHIITLLPQFNQLKHSPECEPIMQILQLILHYNTHTHCDSAEFAQFQKD